MVLLEIESRVGASLRGETVTSNVVVIVALSSEVARSESRPPSSSVTVMVVAPCWLGSGVNCSVPVVLGEV